MLMPPPMVPAPMTATEARLRCGVSAGTSGILEVARSARNRWRSALHSGVHIRLMKARARRPCPRRTSLGGRLHRLHALEPAPGSSSPCRRPCCGRTGSRRRRCGCLHGRLRTSGSGRVSSHRSARRPGLPRPATRPTPCGRTASAPAGWPAVRSFDRLAADDHVQRHLDAQHARQALRATGARDQPELHFRQRHIAAGCGDAVVATQRQLQAAAHRDLCTAATTGLLDASSARITLSRLGSCRPWASRTRGCRRRPRRPCRRR
jgi:hypothetical protein